MNSNHGLSSFPPGPGGKIAFEHKLNKGFENKNCSERKGILLEEQALFVKTKKDSGKCSPHSLCPFPQS